MSTIKGSLAAATAMALAGIAPLSAQGVTQDFKNFAATTALSVTTTGGLPPMVTRSMIGGPAAAGPQLSLRYGRLEFEADPAEDVVTINTLAATGILSLGAAATINGTIGLYNPDCPDPDCDGELMLGLGGDLALGGYAFGVEPSSPRLTLTVGGEIGFTNDDAGSATSAMVNAPVSLVTGASAGWKFVPFLTPGIGFGRLEDDTDNTNYSATRFMLGGGVGFTNTASLISASLGFQKIFFTWDEADLSSRTLFGLTVTIGR